MVAPRHPLIVGLVLALALAGVIGFLAGQGDAHKPAPERVLTASSDGVIVNYPPGWAPAGERRIPGLALERPVVLGPGGSTTRAMLLAGRLPGNEPGPVPAPLVALLGATPRAEVVELVGYQAYRYRDVQLSGAPGELTLYAIPNPSGAGVALACYAVAGSGELQSCERIAGTLTVTEQSQSEDLTPEVAFARPLSTTVETLNRTRTPLRAAMARSVSASALRADAERLATAFAQAAAALAPLEAPQAAAAAKAELIAALQTARHAYTALAAAAHLESQERLASARAAVGEGEAAVATALETLALLGYSQS